MDLLERYLQAVRTYLPTSQQEDILKELGENLRAQMEDKETELGRPLSEDELADILKKHGHPLLVATRYRQSRHLIGSTLFPFYWLAMKIILAIVGFGYAVGVLVMIVGGKSFFVVLGALLNYVGALLPTFAWVTIVFAVLDIGNNKFHLVEKVTTECNRKFNPRSLPALRPTSDSADGKPISRAQTIVEHFFTLAFLLWWIRVSPIRKVALFIALGPVGLADKMPFQMAPVWNTVYWPVILLSIVAIVRQVVMIMHPDRVRFYAVMRLIADGGTVILLYVLTRASELFVLAPGITDAAKFAEALRIVNLVLHYVMIFTAILTVVECFKHVHRLFRIGRNPAAASSVV